MMPRCSRIWPCQLSGLTHHLMWTGAAAHCRSDLSASCTGNRGAALRFALGSTLTVAGVRARARATSWRHSLDTIRRTPQAAVDY